MLDDQFAGQSHQPGAQIVQVDHVFVRELAHEKTAIDVGFQQTGLGESAAGFAHRSAADAEACRECQFVNASAALQFVREDHAFDFGLADIYQRL